MTIAQFIVAYAVSWWLVLFMVLPHGLQMAEKPGPGHVPSAPTNPRLKRKFLLTSLIALLPTVLIYLVSTQAHAAETIYHVGSGCEPLAKHRPSDDLSTKDGEGVHGKKVKSADLESNGNFTMNQVDIPLAIPSEKYVDRTGVSKHNVDLSESFIHAGKISVTRDGEALLNSKSISNDVYDSGDCNGEKDK